MSWLAVALTSALAVTSAQEVSSIVTREPCPELREAVPEASCVTDQRALTVHVADRSVLREPIAKEAMGKLAIRWFEDGGRLLMIHFRLEDEFVACMSIPGGIRCWSAHRSEGRIDVDKSLGTVDNALPVGVE